MGKVAEVSKTASAQLAEGAGAVLQAVAPLIEERYKEAANRAEQAYDWATPHVREAMDKAVEKALAFKSEYADSGNFTLDNLGRVTEKVEGLSANVSANVADARERFVDDYLPRIQQTAAAAGAAAAAAASAAGNEITAGVANVAASAAPQPAPKRRCTVGKTLLVIGVAAAAVGAAYVVWRQTRPQEDPWAPPADFSRPRYPVASNDDSDDDSLAEAVGGAEAGDVAEALKGGDSNPKA